MGRSFPLWHDWDGSTVTDYAEGRQFKAFGKNVNIGYGVVITDPTRVSFGDNVRIDPFCYISGEVTFGSHVHICPRVTILGGAGVTFHNNTGVGPGGMVFSTSEDYRFMLFEGWGGSHVDARPVVFREHSCIGAQAIVMPGVELKTGVRIGARSFVHKSPPDPWTLYLGTPLRKHCNVNMEETVAETVRSGRA